MKKVKQFLAIPIILMMVFAGNTFAQDRFTVDEEIKTYMQLHALDDTASESIGTVSNGKLKHGKLVPYKGRNFMYFDRESYLEGRAFLNNLALNAVVGMYDSLLKVLPQRYFHIMECSNEHGGELFPHRTHQNGLSIDFMMPLQKEGKPYYGLDTIGIEHYALQFDDDGRYTKDTSISIDFNLVARQILLLNHFAQENGLAVFKVIIKIELKEELFATEYGKLLKASDIYVVRGLSPLINSLHDDHFHIDLGFSYTKTPPAENKEELTPSSN
jgi:penicillin-insensitive murein endopeptidase